MPATSVTKAKATDKRKKAVQKAARFEEKIKAVEAKSGPEAAQLLKETRASEAEEAARVKAAASAKAWASRRANAAAGTVSLS